MACTRDRGLIVTDGADFFSEEKRDAASVVQQLEEGVPAYRLDNTCREGRYRIEKVVIADPRRDVVLQHVIFTPLKGRLGDYRPYALLAPDLARQHGVDGYYCRITPGDTPDGVLPTGGDIVIKNRPQNHTTAPAPQIVSPDALAYVRFGLRAADDPRIVATVKVVDALLRHEFPTGSCWRRYNEDGYGEHEDGSPFDGTGIGRHWPLLTGERAHYELAAGRRDEAERLLSAMESFASDGGLLPEQIWDAPDIPDLELYLGRPSGSAMPLVWAHAEHVKLLRSLRDGAVFDTPPQTVRRYLADKTASPLVVWRFNHKLRTMPQGRTLRVEILAPATVRWSADGWRTVTDTEARDTGFGVWAADLPTAALPAGGTVLFTFRWAPDRWEGQDFTVAVEQGG